MIGLLWSVLFASGVDLAGRWRYYEYGYAEKLADPFCNLVGRVSFRGHTERLNYRITVPLVLHLAGLREWLAYIPVTLLALFLLPVLAAAVIDRRYKRVTRSATLWKDRPQCLPRRSPGS